MPHQMQFLDWQPVLLVKVTREPFTGTFCGLQVSRLHLALHPDGVVCAGWDVPPEERNFPRVRLVGWKPRRDVPFRLPVKFVRRDAGAALIASGTWVLPYNHTHFMLYRQLQTGWEALLNQIEAHPISPAVIGQLLQWTTLPMKGN